VTRQRGFTLVELLVSLALSSLVAAGVLLLTRAQLRAYDLNDGIVRAQQNARTGLEFIETQLRRACGGISQGSVAINLPGITPVRKSCLQVWDSAQQTGATFSTSGTTSPDAVEIIYATANTNNTYSATSAAFVAGSTTPSVTVTDMSGFSVGDLVLVTDFKNANLFQIATINGGSSAATGAGPLGFGTLSSASINAFNYTPASGDAVIKATSIALYLVAGSGLTPGQLYLDPDGMVGTDHTDGQPLIEGVSDFQVAVGIDWSTVAPANGTQNDGIITEAASRALNNDEWIGNFAGETIPAPASAAPWNPTVAAAPMLLQIRATVLVRTTNTFTEATANMGPYEDGATITAADSAGRYPRYRAMRMTVAPRAWNLGE
jgi:prepilin-type N-terminal cleavage/methylation domain-containing protein